MPPWGGNFVVIGDGDGGDIDGDDDGGDNGDN